MVMVGASPEDLDALAKQMGQAADDLTQQVRVPLRQMVSYSPWSGSDSSRFRQDWATTLEPQLTRVASALQTAEQSLHRNAQEQRDASSGSGSGGSSSGGSAGGGFVGGGGGGVGGGGWTDSADPSDATTSGGFSISDFAKKLTDTGTAAGEAAVGLTWADYLKGAKGLEKFKDVMGDIAAGVDGVAYVGAAMELASGRGEWSDVVSLAGDAAGLIDKVATWGGATGILKYVGPVGQALGIASDAVKAFEAGQNGDWLGAAYHVAHGVARGVGIACPLVAVGLAAWDVGVAVGPVIASSPVVQELTAKAGAAIGEGIGVAAKVVAEVASNPGKAVGNVVSGAASALNGFVGGFFGKGKK